MKGLDYIRVVLVEPTHPGNIGAIARAMANMGVENLVLINPKEFPSEIANTRAAGADEILSRAKIHSSLDEAIKDCTLVIGTTSRLRSIEWPSLDPKDAMSLCATNPRNSSVAILFGQESRGLTNSELERCHHLVRIPVSEDFASLNLASAVMVMLYELRRSVLVEDIQPVRVEHEPRASAKNMRNFYQHLQSVLQQIEFIDGRSSKLQRKLVRLFNRVHPYDQEVKMLRGILSAIEEKISYKGK